MFHYTAFCHKIYMKTTYLIIHYKLYSYSKISVHRKIGCIQKIVIITLHLNFANIIIFAFLFSILVVLLLVF